MSWASPSAQTCSGAAAASCFPYFLAANATISNLSFGGKIVGPAGTTALPNPLLNRQFATNGVLTPFVNGSTAGVSSSTLAVGGDGAYNTGPSLKAQLNFHQLYGRFDFDLTDDLHYYFTVSGALTHSFNFNSDSRIINVTMRANNAFLPLANQQQLAAANISTFTFGKLWGGNNPGGNSPIPTQNVDFFNRYLYFNTGLEGKLGNYKWEASLTHGGAKQASRQNANIDNGRLFAAMDATLVTAANVGTTGLAVGSVACNVALTNPGLYPGCVPINLFGPTSESQAAVDYVVRRTEYQLQNKMDDVSGSITGAPFNSWAGPVNMALSGEWRKQTYELTSGALPIIVDPLNCTGLMAQNCAALNPTTLQGGTSKWNNSTAANRPEVSLTVSEAALEANVPLLKDRAWVQAADLNAAVRYARYSVKGNPLINQPAVAHTFNALTWKLGLAWRFNDAVTLRATRSRDFRAPNLDELFAPGSITLSSGFTDYFVQPSFAPLAQIQTGGNTSLGPEVAYTTTAGLVFKPTSKLSLAVDAFDIRVGNYIATVNGYGQNIQQACYASGGTSFYCSLQERPLGLTSTAASNAATKWYSTALNIAEQKTWGVDFEANYVTRLYNHPFSLRGLATYQPHVVYVQPGVNTVDAAGTINGSGAGPVGGVWRVSTFARFGVTDKFTVDWLTRWRSKLHLNPDATFNELIPTVSRALTISNLNLSYRFNSGRSGQSDVYLNIQNVFNRLPTAVAFPGAQTEPGLFGGLALGDDPIGRVYSLGVRFKL